MGIVVYQGEKNPNWKGGNVEKACIVCGTAFIALRAKIATAKCCSRKCSSTLGVAALKSRAALKAKKPDKPHRFRPDGPFISVRPAKRCGHLTKAKRDWCSQCSPAQGNRLKTIACVVCGKPFDTYCSVDRNGRKRQLTCSPQCASEHQSVRQRGEKSHLWMGGKTAQTMIERGNYRVQVFRRAVFERDQYICQCCGVKGGRLSADHVLPWSVFPEARFDVDNGRTLCWPCHLKLPTTGQRLTSFNEYVLAVAGSLDAKTYAAMVWVCSPPQLTKSAQLAAMSAWNRENGALAFVARSVSDVLEAIA